MDAAAARGRGSGEAAEKVEWGVGEAGNANERAGGGADWLPRLPNEATMSGVGREVDAVSGTKERDGGGGRNACPVVARAPNNGLFGADMVGICEDVTNFLTKISPNSDINGAFFFKKRMVKKSLKFGVCIQRALGFNILKIQQLLRIQICAPTVRVDAKPSET